MIANVPTHNTRKLVRSFEEEKLFETAEETEACRRFIIYDSRRNLILPLHRRDDCSFAKRCILRIKSHKFEPSGSTYIHPVFRRAEK